MSLLSRYYRNAASSSSTVASPRVQAEQRAAGPRALLKVEGGEVFEQRLQLVLAGVRPADRPAAELE